MVLCLQKKYVLNIKKLNAPRKLKNHDQNL